MKLNKILTAILGVGLLTTAFAQTELNVWIYDTFAAGDATIYQTAADFMAENPDIKINFVPTAPTSSAFRDPFITAAQGGAGPDVLMADIAWSPQFAAMGIVKNLDEYFGDKASEFFDGAMETVMYEGSVYGVPFYTNALGIAYNKTAFEAAGLPLPKAGWTWEDFRTAVDALSDGKMYGFGLQGAWGGTFEWYPWLWQAGGELLTEDGNTPAFNSAEGLEATKFFLNIVTNPNYVPEAAKTWKGWSELGAAFANGVIAMFEVGDWGISIIDQANPSFEWSIAPLPSHRKSASLVGGANWVMNANTRNADAAWRWLEYVTGPAVFPMLDGYNRMAARRGAMTEQKMVADDERMQVFASVLDEARPRPTNPLWTSVDYDCVQPAFLRVILEGADVNATMAEAELCAIDALR